MRRFIIDYNVTIEFDRFGFFVKDIQTGIPLMRCDNIGDLYPLTTTTRHQSTSPATFAALSPTLWHNRLGHPEQMFYVFLAKISLLSVNKSLVLLFVNLAFMGNMLNYLFLFQILLLPSLLI